jgi:hypothetical protein
MEVRTNSFFRLVVLLVASLTTQQGFAAGVNFAGSTESAAAAVAMNGQTTHITDSGQIRPLLVSAQGKYPPVDYKPQVFQREYSLIRVPQPRNPKRNEFILKNNDKIFTKLAEMYKKTQAYAATQNRKLMIDVLTVQAVGEEKGFARSRQFAEYIFKSLKDKGVENISLDPQPRDPIPLPPELIGGQPKGRT